MRVAYIGMGGNLPSQVGRPEATLTAAAERLNSLGRITRRSSLYSTGPVGFADQPRFVNAVVELETELEPKRLLEGLLKIEHEFGRDRTAGVRNGPRTLDLDILLYGDVRISEPGLEIPHPRLKERQFVLRPMCEIAPSIVHAGYGVPVSQLLDHLKVGTESGEDAPIPIQSDDWPAGACRGGVGRNAADRADGSQPEPGDGR
jgi:2-amino-4-hydroxy-6-hydroxymethyldihydropteridine diphosphokinase